MIQKALDWVTRDWALKLTALALAFLLWTSVRAEQPGTWQPTTIPVQVLNDDPEWIVVDPPSPQVVEVHFRGPYRELLRAASDPPQLIVPFEDVDDSVMVRAINRNWVRMPPGTEQVVIDQIIPAEVRVAFDRVNTRLLPVAAAVSGELPPGYELSGEPQVEPAMVRASGPGRALARMDSLRLPVIDLRDRRTRDTLQLTIDTTGTGLIVSPRNIRVILPIQATMPDSSAVPLSPPPGERSPRD